MKILVVQESDWVKRGPHQQHHLFERLSKLGHKIRVIDYEIDWKTDSQRNLFSWKQIFYAESKSIKNQMIKIVRPFLIKVPLFCYLSILLFHTVEIFRQIKSFTPDVIVGLGIVNAYTSARIAKMFQMPFIYYLIDSLYTLIPERIFHPLGKLLERKTLDLASQVLVINKQLGRYVTRQNPSKESDIITAGIDKSRFHPGIESKGLRKDLQIPENKVVIFFMGWLYEFSGLREVAHSLSHGPSEIHLLVLGRGELEQELKKIAQKTDATNITVVDWVPYDDVPNYLAVADICILPAHLNDTMKDIVPIKLYEYLACGKPVITTKLPGVMGEFGNSSGIIYVDHPRETVAKAEEIWSNSKLLRKLKEDGIDFTKSLDWNQITLKFLTLLQSLK